MIHEYFYWWLFVLLNALLYGLAPVMLLAGDFSYAYLGNGRKFQSCGGNSYQDGYMSVQG